MNERLKILREHLKISQETLGEKINVTRSHISSIEKGKRALTDRVITDICREFNVNEEWLRNGTGEIFNPTTNDKLKQLSQEYKLSKLEETFFSSYLNLTPEKREAVCEFFEDILNKNLSFTSNELVSTKEETFEERKQRELDAYALELDAQEKGRILSVSEKPKGA